MSSHALVFFVCLRNILVVLGHLLEAIVVVQGNESVSPNFELSMSIEVKVESRKFGNGEIESQAGICFCKGRVCQQLPTLSRPQLSISDNKEQISPEEVSIWLKCFFIMMEPLRTQRVRAAPLPLAT